MTITPSARVEQEVTLPESLMKALKVITESTNQDGGLTPREAYVSTVLITFGHAMYERADTIDPTAIKLPEVQWREICQLLIDMKGDDLARTNYGLDWVNQGPSSRE